MHKKIRAALICGFFTAAGIPVAQSQTDDSLSLWAPIPEWAYGYDTQPEPGDQARIPTPGNRALQPGEDAEELSRPLRLESKSAPLTLKPRDSSCSRCRYRLAAKRLSPYGRHCQVRTLPSLRVGGTLIGNLMVLSHLPNGIRTSLSSHPLRRKPASVPGSAIA